MQILHIINRAHVTAGAAKLLLDLASKQVQEHNDVMVLCLVNIEHNYQQAFINAGVKYEILLNDSQSFYNPLCIVKLRKYIKAKYDIIHVHLFPSLYWAAISKIIFGSKSKFLYTEHAPHNNRRKSYLKPIERFIYRQYDSIVSISEDVHNNLSKHLGAKFNGSIISNGIDIQSFKNAHPINRLTFNISKDDIIITQIARFGSEKDQKTVIKALSILPPMYHVIFVGDGPLINEHIEFAKKYHVFERTHFLGHCNNVPQIIKTSDIIVISSHFEGFGLAAVEGMSGGKPIVASNIPGLNSVVSNAGKLFTQYDYIDLANQIQEIIASPALYKKMVEDGKTKAEKYAIEKMYDAYIKLYQSL